ncbi:MAG: hypothetical protein HZC17_04195 [Candidatus Omnitrophica bacterium]|nr:hypothetical protein [Candidatus Omnitrophota bacterium]
MKRILLILLILALAILLLAAIADKAVTIVALGDSTTAGTPGFRSPAEAPPDGAGNPQSQYEYWIMQRHPEWQVINRGVNGWRSDKILRKFDSEALPYKPEVVIVLAGVNDLYQGRPVEEVQENLKKIYAMALEKNIKVIACTLLPYNNITPDVLDDMMVLNRWIKFYAQEKGLGFCDTFSIVEDPEKHGFLAASPDGLHPDITGYRKIGNAIADTLEEYLHSS